MPYSRIKVLLVDDDEEDFIITGEYLSAIKEKKIQLVWASGYEKGLQEISTNTYDVLLFDFLLGGKSGIDLLIEAKKLGCEAPVILLTGKGDLSTDIEAMRHGAADYLDKTELDSEKLDRSIRFALERAAASKELMISEEKYRSIFEKSYDLIYITDLSGNFIDCNDSVKRIFGYEKSEFLKMNAIELYYYPEDRPVFLSTIESSGAVSNFELTLKHKNGEKKFCLISATTQRNSDDSINYLGVIHDITRRKKAEKDLIIAEKLAVTGRVVRTLAHEIRNPLTNINLSLEQMRSENKIPEMDFYYDIILRNSNRINDLISDLLYMSRPSEVSRLECSVDVILEETLEMAGDRIRLKGIEIRKSLAAGDSSLNLDVEKIKIAFLNIIINAVEAMAENAGVLLVRSELVESRCLITIEDNGIGISKENIGRLFEPYFTNKATGVGLGLATAHNILQSHNATIDVESEIGKGTRFVIGFEIGE